MEPAIETPPTREVEPARLLTAQQAVSSCLAESPPSAHLFQQVLRTACETLGWSFGAAWRLDAGADALTCVAVWNASGSPAVGDFGVASFEQRFEAGRGLPGQVWETGAPVWLSDLRWDPRMASIARAGSAGLRGAVAIPLGSGTGFEGVLEFFSHEIRQPDEEAMTWLATTGAQVTQHLARWRAQDALVAHDRALAATTNGVVISDATVRGFPIVYVNAGFERLTGYALTEVSGRPCSLLQGPDTDPAALAELSEALAARREARVTLRNYRKDGTAFWNELRLSPVLDAEGELVQYIGVQHDVTEQRVATEQADFFTYHDALTGLANRALLQKVLTRAAARAERHGLSVALLYLDLDAFTALNNEFGSAAGDKLLCAVAEALSAVARPGDLVVRQGGDGFLIVMADLGTNALADAMATADRMKAAVDRPVQVADGQVTIRSSIGASLLGAGRDARDSDALLRHAETAMQRAKRTGHSMKLYQATGAAQAPAAVGAELDAGSLEERAAELDRQLSHELIRAVYQPIVDLASGDVVGYEALARGAEGSSLTRPDQLFGTAHSTGRLGELDWACRGAAVREALAQGLAPPRKLFVNVEPRALGLPCPDHLTEDWKRAGGELDVIVEITERALTSRPAQLLHAVTEMRRRGWGIALDDVGADVRSLALMPLLRPDVIKLDLRLVQEQPTMEIAEIVHAVNAEHERTGAVILAEGIETEAQLATALALGATVGQGWLFGRPVALEAPTAPLRHALALCPPVAGGARNTPYEAVRAHREVRRADKRLLLSVSKHLEQQAAALGESGVIVSAFQSAERFTELTRRRYTLLAADAAFVAALGVGMPPEPAPGVRGANLEPHDALLGEWSVVVLGPHFAAALVAVDLGDEGPDMQRRFDFALTYDRELVIEAVNALMTRVSPLAL